MTPVAFAQASFGRAKELRKIAINHYKTFRKLPRKESLDQFICSLEYMIKVLEINMLFRKIYFLIVNLFFSSSEDRVVRKRLQTIDSNVIEPVQFIPGVPGHNRLADSWMDRQRAGQIDTH